MIALLISLVISLAAIAASTLAHAGTGGTIAAGLAGFLIPQLLIGFVVRKKIAAVQNQLQTLLLNGRQQISRKIQMFQNKPGGNIKQIQRQLEADQNALLTEALASVAHFEPFKKWNLLMGRQIDTMRLQFLYQLKDFDAVDQLLAIKGPLKGPMMLDPLTVAMKMARQYLRGDLKGLEKTFQRHIRWMRGDRGTLLYGIMSWVYVKQGESSKAQLLLAKAKETTANETLALNWEKLSNRKESQFSNAGLGEEWYGLYLETPPIPKQQKIRVNPHGRRPF
jgi:hypothetical protein